MQTAALALPGRRFVSPPMIRPTDGHDLLASHSHPMSRAYLELLRPANVVTALGDVLAGFAIAGLRHPERLPWLLLSSCCLYAGGVVLNDVFDRDLDRVERPERPIPSGRVSTQNAAA